MPWIAKAILRKSKVGDSTLSDFKLYHKAIIKQYGFGIEVDTSIEPSGEPRNIVNPHIHDQLICDKRQPCQ